MTDALRLEGTLRLKAADRNKWLRADLELPSLDRYASAGFGAFEPAHAPQSCSIKELLDDLMRDRHVRVRLTYARSPIVISGAVPDDAVSYYWPALVGAFEQAAARGGKGRIALTFQRAHAMRVRLDGEGQAILETVDLRKEAAAAAGPLRVPGVIEPARSGRSSCRACKQPIASGELRFGAQDLSKAASREPTFRWLHLSCAARVMPHSFGPVLREATVDVPGREALWASLPQDAQSARRPRAFKTGASVTVKGGRRGEVVWYGKNKFGAGTRVGVKIADGDEVLWLSEEDVTEG